MEKLTLKEAIDQRTPLCTIKGPSGEFSVGYPEDPKVDNLCFSFTMSITSESWEKKEWEIIPKGNEKLPEKTFAVKFPDPIQLKHIPVVNKLRRDKIIFPEEEIIVTTDDIVRYHEMGKEIPPEWLHEHNG